MVAGMDARSALPEWLAVTPAELRDLSCLALRLVVEQRSREAAGMVAVASWLHGQLRGPATARDEGPRRRDVALAELCAAECLVDDGHPPPPLHDVCQLLEVSYRPPIDVDAGYGRGVWLTLRWALGKASRPPLDLPIRRRDGRLMGEVEIYAELVAAGRDRAKARRAAVLLATDSVRLADLVEDAAARIRS
jgi:hypothetical protein